ncbi:MAG: hypothetical protein IH905_10440 [Proteobacteria bacterium]|nr:hypothetical protein [Pseudomonadota bacterium]
MMDRLKREGEWAIGTALMALVLVLTGALASQAQDNAEDVVRAMLEQMYLGTWFGATGAGFELGAPLRLSRRGPPSSLQFDAVIPEIRFTDSEGRRTEVGDITLEITVLGEGRFDISGDLPKEIAIYNRSGGVLSRVRAKRHQVEGIWNANISQFETIDWESGGWRAVDAAGAQVFAMSSGRLTATLEQTSPTHGDSVAELELSDISVTAGRTGVLQIDRIKVSGEVRNTNLIAYGKLLGDFFADSAHDPSDPETLNALNVLIFSNFGLLGDVDYLIRIEGLFGRFGGLGQTIGRFSVDSIEFGFGLEGLDDPTGTIRLRYGHRGVDLPIAAVPPGVVPHSVALSLSFQGLPLQAMMQIVAEYADLTQDGEPGPAADDAFGEAMIGLWTEAQSVLAIDELSLEADILALDGRGTVRPDPAGRGPVTGKGRITIRGLERLQRELLSEISTETLGYVAILGIFMALGEEVEDERGRGFVYNLEVGPEGQLLINGQDFAPLFEELNSP